MDQQQWINNSLIREEMEISKDKQIEQVSQLKTKIKYPSQEIDQLKTKSQIQDKKIEKISKGCQQIEMRFGELLQDMEKLKDQEIQQLKATTIIQTQEIEKLKQKFQLIESRFEDIRQKEEKCKDVQMKLEEISQASSVLKEESMETRKSKENVQEIIDEMNYEEIEWKIDYWPDEVSKAGNYIDRQIFSEDFFTNINGYKICFSAYSGSYIFGIRLYILRGPFDDFLRWPFNRDLECSLMNQKSGHAYKSISIKCSDYPNRVELQKPACKINEAAFAFDFDISPYEISNNPELCQNGQIFIKFSAKPAKHLK